MAQMQPFPPIAKAHWDGALLGAGVVSLILHLLLGIGFYFWLEAVVEIQPKPPMEIAYVVPDEHFIEVNRALEPEAPPEDTPFFACADQKAAQLELSAPDDSPLPQETSGELDAHKVVHADMDAMEAIAQMAFEEAPLDGEEAPKAFEDSPQEPVRLVENTLDQDALFLDALFEEALSIEPAIQVQNRPKPQPRPRVQVKSVLTDGPLRQDKRSCGRLGVTAVDARFSEYGDYLQRMIDIIYSQWVWLVERSYRNLPRGHSIFIQFSLMPDGTIERLESQPEGASSIALRVCQDAILSRQPFDPWTESMLQTLGMEGQQLSIHFHF
jgi:hypothetical protein